MKNHEKSEKAADTKLKTSIEKYHEVIQYLEHELDYQRKSNEEIMELFNNLEKTLRDTVYRKEDAEAKCRMLEEELTKSKTELHQFKYKSHEEVRVMGSEFKINVTLSIHLIIFTL